MVDFTCFSSMLQAKLLRCVLPKETKCNYSFLCGFLTVSLICLSCIYRWKAYICSLYFSLKARNLQIPCTYLVQGETSCSPCLSRKLSAVYIVKRCFGLNSYFTVSTVYILKTKDLLFLFILSKSNTTCFTRDTFRTLQRRWTFMFPTKFELISSLAYRINSVAERLITTSRSEPFKN
jgi:hypothetical protein